MLSTKKNKKAVYFLILTMIFSLFSFFIRDYLIFNYNNANFGLFKVDYIKNYGAAFSLLHTHTSLLIVISAFILLFAIIYILKNIAYLTKTDLFFSSLLCSGITCNLIERLIDGFVTDYIRLNLIAFPIFNMSDLFISIGAFVLICNILFNNEPKKD